MSDPGSPTPRLIDARIERSKDNALRLIFRGGPGEPFAIGRQNAGGGFGKKLGVLFGFKNGGTGIHELSIGSRVLGVTSRDGAPTEISEGIGGPLLATIDRGKTSTALDAAGVALLRFLPRSPESKTADLFRIDLQRPDGSPVGILDVVRRGPGWGIAGTIDRLIDIDVWWDAAGQSLPIPLLGARVLFEEPPSALSYEVVLAACVDITIGLRPYFEGMGS